MYHPAMDSDTDRPTRPVSSRCVAKGAQGAGTSQGMRSQIAPVRRAHDLPHTSAESARYQVRRYALGRVSSRAELASRSIGSGNTCGSGHRKATQTGTSPFPV
jgi:hypothetical protein